MSVRVFPVVSPRVMSLHHVVVSDNEDVAHVLQIRKMNMLGEQYEGSISEMMQQQNVSITRSTHRVLSCTHGPSPGLHLSVQQAATKDEETCLWVRLVSPLVQGTTRYSRDAPSRHVVLSHKRATCF